MYVFMHICIYLCIYIYTYTHTHTHTHTHTGEAIEHLARAAVAAPDNPDVHFYLVSALRQHGLYAQSNEVRCIGGIRHKA
jgi:hypothetical protein